MGRIASIVVGAVTLVALSMPVATADTIGADAPVANDLVASTLATTDELASFIGEQLLD